MADPGERADAEPGELHRGLSGDARAMEGHLGAIARETGSIEHEADAVERDARAIEHAADAALDRHPRWARIVDLARRVIAEQATEQVGLAASGAAFWVVISSFPTAIAAISLFGLIVNPEQVAGDLGGLARAGPSSFGSTVTDQLRNVAASDHTGLSVGLAVSVILALWSASAGVYNLDRAVRTAYGLPRQSYMDARGRALIGSFVVVILVGLVGFVAAGISAIRADLGVPAAAIAVVGLPVLLVVILLVAAALYRFSVGRGASVLPGAIASAFGIVLVAGGFAAYVHVSTHYTAVYGALAGAVIAMIGAYLAVFIVLIGAVLNVQMAQGTGARQTAQRLKGEP